MTERKIDFMDFQKEGIMSGAVSGSQYDKDLLKKFDEKILILRFDMDPKGERVVSRYNSRFVFADRDSNLTPEIGEVWACALKYEKSGAYIVDLLLKITPVLLLKLDEEKKKEILKTLWEQNKKEYVAKFEELYRVELYKETWAKFEEEHSAIIREKDERIAALSADLDVMRALNKKREIEEKYSAPGHEVGKAPAPPKRERVPILPSTNQSMAPGLPDVNINEVDFEIPPDSRFHVLCRSGALYSESFPDGHYFVHITPTREFVVVRPHSSGGALCIGHSINVKALQETLAKCEGKELVCEYNPRYQGLIVYINRPIDDGGTNFEPETRIRKRSEEPLLRFV